jgi:hypothetical protein
MVVQVKGLNKKREVKEFIRSKKLSCTFLSHNKKNEIRIGIAKEEYRL